MATSATRSGVTEEERRRRRKNTIAVLALSMLLTSTAFSTNSVVDITPSYSSMRWGFILETNMNMTPGESMESTTFLCFPDTVKSYYDSPSAQLFVTYLFIGVFVRFQMGIYLLEDVKNPKGYIVSTCLGVVAIIVMVTWDILNSFNPWTGDTDYLYDDGYIFEDPSWIIRHCFLDLMMTGMYALFIVALKSTEP